MLVNLMLWRRERERERERESSGREAQNERREKDQQIRLTIFNDLRVSSLLLHVVVVFLFFSFSARNRFAVVVSLSLVPLPRFTTESRSSLFTLYIQIHTAWSA